MRHLLERTIFGYIRRQGLVEWQQRVAVMCSHSIGMKHPRQIDTFALAFDRLLARLVSLASTE
jgi:hypothetical protein